MKFVINTNYRSAGSKVCVDDLVPRLKRAGHEVVRNDWDGYEKYDVALFMAPDSDVRGAKKKNPKIICAVMDPKAQRSSQIDEAKAADMLLVSSIEQRDLFYKWNKRPFIYYMFPDVPEVPKEHVKKEKIVIGYHGNKLHLHAMKEVTWALDELAKKYPIELLAVYNIEHLGKWSYNLPRVCPVRHVQWSEEAITKELSKADVGIVPALLPVPRSAKVVAQSPRSHLSNLEGYNKKDYFFRFKYSNNPGRIYVFSRLHLPVIADPVPSSCQFIRDGFSGKLAFNREGWANSLEEMINNVSLRKEYGENLKQFIDDNYSIDLTFSKFLELINTISNDEKK
jgi:hypothetical protein